MIDGIGEVFQRCPRCGTLLYCFIRDEWEPKSDIHEFTKDPCAKCLTFFFENIKLENNYKRISNGGVLTGQQLLNLLDVAGPDMQAIILLDTVQVDEPATHPELKYGV